MNWVVVDIVRIENGLIAEHWDGIQDEATRESLKSGRPMFGDMTAALQRASDRSVAETSGSADN